jgi:hypothetical protein
MTANLSEASVFSLTLKQTNYKIIMVEPSGAMSTILAAMKRAVWAIFFLTSCQQMRKPQHGLCTCGDDSWFKFKDNASSGVAYQHKHSLPAAGMDAIKPVFRGLASLGSPNVGCLGPLKGPFCMQWDVPTLA